MEELHASPYIVDSLGYCQLSIFVEALPLGDMKAKAAPLEKRRQQKLNDEKDVDPKNNFTVAEKVSYCLDMARGVRDLQQGTLIIALVVISNIRISSTLDSQIRPR